ncbi:cation-translocating P-type ATPase [Candidatus Micrarchaeota archaeon]|nr:cation-translocating P-type ATPase [Candidatus Micrarchaeota archaeon]
MPGFTAMRDDLLRQLESSQTGLTSAQARFRFLRDGPNALEEAPKVPAWRRFLTQFESPLVILLILAALVAAVLGEWLDSAAIGIIVLLNAAFGFIQENRAERAIAALQDMVALKATVLRDGVEMLVDARNLVTGDVILLPEGSKVPADGRLLESFSLQVDEAALTGESVASEKDARASIAADAPLAERTNAVFMGTHVRRGRARAIVVKTGMRTELGKIAGLVQGIGEPPTPLQVKLEQLGRRLGFLAVCVCVLVFLSGLWSGVPLADIFLISVSLAVAAVPEGLPAVVTITLAIGVQRMARRHALVRRLPAVETLGCATIIGTDKTGTLTKNEMTVRHVWTDGAMVDVSGTGFSSQGTLSQTGKPVGRHVALDRLLECGVYCNSASLTANGVLGDPTEGALLVLSEKAGVSVQDLRRQGTLVEEVPFSSERKMMSVVRERDGKRTVYCKGAPEVLLKRCTRVLWEDTASVLTSAVEKKILARNESFAKAGLRVLALAYREGAKGSGIEQGLTFLGLVAMYDPPRDEVRESVRKAQAAGIRVVMITGDNPLTAQSVAREIGLEADRVSDGHAVSAATDAELDRLCAGCSVFARVSPEDKLRIVASLKRLGQVVAVTGDGVNDAPAIKTADIGVAMGITGTDVAKESADMVIADDDFSSIVAAVEEGRTVYDNIVKSVLYLVSCNIGEVLTIFAAIALGLGRAFGIESPLAPIHILWMNLVTDGMPALALGMEPKEPDAMRRPPRRRDDAVFSRARFLRAAFVGVWMALGTLLLYWTYLENQPEKAVTVAFSTLIFFQLFFALSSRSERHPLWHVGFWKNPWVWLAILAAAFLQLVAVQWPVANGVFQTVPLAAPDWLNIVAVCVTLLVAVETLKTAKKWG